MDPQWSNNTLQEEARPPSKVEKKQYDEALDLLAKSQAELSADSYFYNKGLIFEKKNNLIEARFNYEKAQSLGLKDKKLDQNLGRVYENLGVSYLEEAQSFEHYFIQSSLEIPASFALFSFLLILVSCAYLGRSLRKITRVLLLMILVIPFICGAYIRFNYGYALANGDVALRLGPSRSMERIIDLPSGLKVIVKKKTQRGWTEVYFPEDFKGWVQNNQFLLYWLSPKKLICSSYE